MHEIGCSLDGKRAFIINALQLASAEAFLSGRLNTCTDNASSGSIWGFSHKWRGMEEEIMLHRHGETDQTGLEVKQVTFYEYPSDTNVLKISNGDVSSDRAFFPWNCSRFLKPNRVIDTRFFVIFLFTENLINNFIGWRSRHRNNELHSKFFFYCNIEV